LGVWIALWNMCLRSGELLTHKLDVNYHHHIQPLQDIST
jgi:hypothetical protein